MLKYIEVLDRAVMSIINCLVGISAFLLTFITLLQVLARYIFKVSIGGLGELPVYFMMVCIWLTAATAVRKRDHVTVDFINVFIKNKTVVNTINFIIELIGLVTTLVFTKLSFNYVLTTMKSGNTSPGLRFPLWWLAVIIFISAVLMSIYYIVYVGKKFKEVTK